MNAKKSIVLAGMLLACMVLTTGCPEVITEIPEEPGRVPPPVGFEPLTAFLSADRAELIRGDAVLGNAVLTVTTNRETTFRWSLAGPDHDGDGNPDWEHNAVDGFVEHAPGAPPVPPSFCSCIQVEPL